MSQILQIKGKVKYPITLDPGVWIFDDRRIDLDTYFHKKEEENVPELTYEEKLAKYWQREIQESSVSPPTLKTEIKYEKEKVLTGTFGIFFEPFLNHAEPDEDAEMLVFETKNGNIKIPLNKGKEIIFKFSENGKPLKENGPVYVLYKDGSNFEQPIKGVTGIIVE